MRFSIWCEGLAGLACTMVCVRCVSDLLAALARVPTDPLDHFPILTLPASRVFKEKLKEGYLKVLKGKRYG